MAHQPGSCTNNRLIPVVFSSTIKGYINHYLSLNVIPFVCMRVNGVIKGRPEYEEICMPLKIDVGEDGFNMVLKPYQIEAMKYLWVIPGEGRSSREVYEAVNDALPGGSSISRASIINSMNALVDDGVLSFHEITGKGGHRRIYKSVYDESGFKQFIAETVLRKLLHDFPEETRKAIHKVI